MRNRWKGCLGALLALFATATLASPLTSAEIPAPLKGWEAWVLHDADVRACPPDYDQADQRSCTWPSRLSLVLNHDGGSFVLAATGYRPDWLPLPGDDSHWPQDVRVDNVAAPVVPHGGTPALWLASGNHRIEGRFLWNQLPEQLATPPATGLISVDVNGTARGSILRDSAGNVWLGKAATVPVDVSDHLAIKVFRLIDDDIPQRMTVHVDLEVAGRSREALIGPALPKDFIPLALDSTLPARLDDDGRLHLQLRPGLWSLELTGRSPAPLNAFAFAAAADPWPAQEIWSLRTHNDLRLVEPAGAAAVDPRQTRMPDGWRSLPAFAMAAGTKLELVEKQRGNLQAEPDALNLHRELWLDFDGKGWTLRDDIGGNLRRHWRVEAAAPVILGRVEADGEPQLITLGSGGGAGIEVRHGALKLSAESRIETPLRRLPVAGWNVDFQDVVTTLHLPSGWRLFAASGTDNVPETWLSRWTLLDLFLVLIIAIAALRLFGLRTGLITALALVLCWHEPGAPRWSFLNLIAVLALVIALPEAFRQAAVMRWLRRYAWLSAMVLLLVSLPFAVQQAHWALYPQLEGAGDESMFATGSAVLPQARENRVAAPAPVAEPAAVPEGAAEDEAAKEAPPSAPPPPRPMMKMAAAPVALAAGGLSSVSSMANYARQSLTQLLPNQLTQTGPGLPDWGGNTVALHWSGPVVADQSMCLWLMPRWLVRLWRLGSIAGIIVVMMLWLRAALAQAPGGLRPGSGSPARGAVAGVTLLVLLAASASPGRAWADDAPPPAADMAADEPPVKAPPAALLEELKKRLLAPPDCADDGGACADLQRLTLDVKADALMLRLTLDAMTDTAVPLPVPALTADASQAAWQPTLAEVDGHEAPLHRDSNGSQLWMVLARGHHEVQVSGSLAGMVQLQLPLPLKPHRIGVAASGWDVAGVNDDGTAGDAIQLSRQQVRSPAAGEAAGVPQALPGFMVITRTLRLGLDWNVDSSVQRIGTIATPVVARLPLLPGEVLTTEGLRVKEGSVELAFAAGQAQAGWASRLPVTPALALQAAQTHDFVEQWRLDASPLWHVEMDGIPPVQVQQNDYWLPGWQPWPGEKVALKITRPPATAGQSLTLDKASVVVTPGARATDLRLDLHLRASQGGQQWMTLPEGAEVLRLTVDGQVQPARVEKGRIALGLHPGAQDLSLQLRQVRDLSLWLRTPAIDPGLPGVNADITLDLPEDRWLLWLRGPQLGPAVLFWGLLAVLVVVGIGLARLPLTPLRARHWVLLLIGLSQGPLWAAVVVVALWLLLGLRGRVGADLSATRFQLMQIGLALLTAGSAVLLFDAVAQGLLGYPNMQIAGNGSYGHHLHWYQDRFARGLPTVAVLSVPIWVYRLLMLLWALWLANALLGWLRWGWTQVTHNGLWKKGVRRQPPAPPVVADAATASPAPAPPPEG